MGRLTVEQVNAAALSLQSRASVSIDSLESKKGFFGAIAGNNDTIEQTQGSLRMIRDTQVPRWRNNGLDIAANDIDDKVDGWVSVGQDFAKAISEIDGYGEDATLSSVISATASQTATDIKDKVVPALSFGIGAGVVIIAAIAVAYFYILAPKRQA